jgi:predicted small lipoprotein YifL
MKKLLLALAALASVSIAACEEKNPVEKAADEIEDVVDEAS